MNVLLIGCGGIGSWLCHFMEFGRRNFVLPAGTEITVADPDVVESRNLMFSNFHPEDVGKNKAHVMASRYRFNALSRPASAADVASHGIVLVATDNAASRRMVHEGAKLWVDTRCKGSLWTVFTSSEPGASAIRDVDMKTENESCQFRRDLGPGGSVKFGCLVAAAAGWQKTLDLMRAGNSSDSQQSI